MDGYDSMGVPPYLNSPMGMGTIEADSYHGGVPTLALPEHLTTSYDTSDFGL